MIHCRQTDGIRTLTIDRPAAANAIDAAAADELAVRLGDADAARAVVLTGAGRRAFCAGIDLRSNPDLLGERDLAIARTEALWRCIEAMVRCPVPVMCLVNGPAVGAGAMLALLADRLLCHEDASLQFPEVLLGMHSPLALEIVATVSNEMLALDLVNTGRRLPASEALARGLVQAVYDDASRDAVLAAATTGLPPEAWPAVAQNRRWIGVRRLERLRHAHEAARAALDGAAAPGRRR